MKLSYCLILSCLLILFSHCLFAKHPKKTRILKIKHTIVVSQLIKNYTSKASINGKSELIAELNKILNEDNTSQIAVYVRSMKGGEVLYNRNANHLFVPASTLKVLTAEAALLYLGPEYRFSTQLLTDAKNIKRGVLQGNIYLVLSGDPTLGYDDLVELLFILKTHKINAISGNVYIDHTAYDNRYFGPGWDDKDKGYCYSAPIGAAIINHNCISFSVMPGRAVGYPAQVVTSSKYFYPTIKNAVVTKISKARGCSLHLATTPGSVIKLEGCIPKNRIGWGVSYVIADVPEYNRNLVKNILARIGVQVRGNVSFGVAGDNLSLVGQHASKPLRLMVTDMLKKSNNIIAGALFKKMGQLYTKKQGSWETGSYAVAQILAKRAKVDIKGLRILDGSGLSPNNLITPAQLMQVLDFAYHHPNTSYEFVSALPVSGIDGTLKMRMNNIPRKVRAKTGTISGVVSLAGYAVSAEKEPLAFVIMINGQKGLSWQYRSIEDNIATALTRYKRSGGVEVAYR